MNGNSLIVTSGCADLLITGRYLGSILAERPSVFYVFAFIVIHNVEGNLLHSEHDSISTDHQP